MKQSGKHNMKAIRVILIQMLMVATLLFACAAGANEMPDCADGHHAPKPLQQASLDGGQAEHPLMAENWTLDTAATAKTERKVTANRKEVKKALQEPVTAVMAYHRENWTLENNTVATSKQNQIVEPIAPSKTLLALFPENWTMQPEPGECPDLKTLVQLPGGEHLAQK
jgi:hypothetical protein